MSPMNSLVVTGSQTQCLVTLSSLTICMVPTTTSKHLIILLVKNLWLGLALAFLKHPLPAVSQTTGQGCHALSFYTSVVK